MNRGQRRLKQYPDVSCSSSGAALMNLKEASGVAPRKCGITRTARDIRPPVEQQVDGCTARSSSLRRSSSRPRPAKSTAT